MSVQFAPVILRPASPLKGVLPYCLAVVFGCLLAALPAFADPPDRPATGLMWHRSALPATFPLQVKTAPGRDYYLTLSEADTGRAVLAAFIHGGEFFRVLVPPGTFSLRFDYGKEWQGEEGLFGTGRHTGAIELARPLRFGVKGIGTKAGHLVDLSGRISAAAPDVAVSADAICQSVRVSVRRTVSNQPAKQPTPLERAEFLRQTPLTDPEDPTRIEHWYPDPQYSTQRRFIVYTRSCG